MYIYSYAYLILMTLLGKVLFTVIYYGATNSFISNTFDILILLIRIIHSTFKWWFFLYNKSTHPCRRCYIWFTPVLLGMMTHIYIYIYIYIYIPFFALKVCMRCVILIFGITKTILLSSIRASYIVVVFLRLYITISILILNIYIYIHLYNTNTMDTTYQTNTIK